MREAWIIDAVRSPIGRHGGALAAIRPDDLAAQVIRALLDRASLSPELVDDVLLGCANQAGEDNRNVARMALLRAGLPVETPGQTVNRLCGSGMQAVVSAFHAILAGEGSVFVAGGVESMSRAPYVLLKAERPYARGPLPAADTVLGWRFPNPAFPKEWTMALGRTAEVVAREFQVSREAQDAFACESQARARDASESGRCDDEVVEISVPGASGAQLLARTDEHPRPGTTMEQLSGLRPVFERNGTVTAGNASGINDGAAALLVVEAGRAAQLGLAPLAAIRSSGLSGVSPERMGIGPVKAAQSALGRAGWEAGALDLAELNEAFAAQVLPCMEQLGIPRSRVNVNGGAIALGHPIGCSGARIVGALAHEMTRRKARRGLAAMCIGVGQGIALTLERS